jgi:serine/threonine protein kinase
LKPGNILISIEKYRCILKYADYGFSKHTGQSLTNTYAGTPLYEAPEFWSPMFGKTQCELFCEAFQIVIFSLVLVYRFWSLILVSVSPSIMVH